MKAIRKMHPQIARRVMTAIEALAEDPRPSGVATLRGQDAFRIRVADYRVVYTINDNELTVVVIRAGHRREIYRR